MPDTNTLYFDGSSSPHKGGPAGWGFVLILEDGEEITEGGWVDESLGNTNNVAEYTSLIKGLEKALSLGITYLHIIGDSQLIIYQVMGKYKVKHPQLIPLHQEVKSLLTYFTDYNIEWKRRVHNKADAFSRGG